MSTATFTCYHCDETFPAGMLSKHVAKAAGMTRVECCQELPAERLVCVDCDSDADDNGAGWFDHVAAWHSSPVAMYSGSSPWS